MEEEIQIKNQYTYNNFIDFANFHCKKIQGIRYLRYLGVFMICATIYFYITTPEMTLLGFIFNPSLFLSVLFIFMSSWLPGNTAKQLYKKCQENDGLENTITFDKDKVKFVSKQVEEIYFYKQLHKCYETENYFYIYVRRSTAQIVCKSNFVKGEVETLRNFLKKEPNIKFVQKCKNIQ